LRLIQFKRIDSGSFSLLWDDEHSGMVGTRQLRDACPCAGCKGESVLFQHHVPVPDPSPHPEKYVLQSAEMVGNYALKFVWGDGHGEGLYVWEHLRSLCGCPECSARREADTPDARLATKHEPDDPAGKAHTHGR